MGATAAAAAASAADQANALFWSPDSSNASEGGEGGGERGREGGLLPSRVSALRGETRAGAGAVDVRHESRLSPGDEQERRRRRRQESLEAGANSPPAFATSPTDGDASVGVVEVAEPRLQGQQQQPQLEVCCGGNKVGRAASSLGRKGKSESAQSVATTAAASVASSSVGAVSVSRRLISTAKGERGGSDGWWSATAGGKGGGGQEGEGEGDDRPPRPARPMAAECHSSWRLPSPAAAAAAAASSSGLSNRGGSSSEPFSGDGPSARSGATDGSDKSGGGGRTQDVAGLGDVGGPAADAAAAAAATAIPPGSNTDRRHLTGRANEDGGGAMPPSTTATRQQRRASMLSPAAPPGGGNEDRRRSVGDVPAPSPAHAQGSRLRSGGRGQERAVAAANARVGAGAGAKECPGGREGRWLRLLEAWLLPALLLAFVVRQVCVFVTRVACGVFFICWSNMVACLYMCLVCFICGYGRSFSTVYCCRFSSSPPPPPPQHTHTPFCFVNRPLSTYVDPNGRALCSRREAPLLAFQQRVAPPPPTTPNEYESDKTQENRSEDSSFRFPTTNTRLCFSSHLLRPPGGGRVQP